MIDSLRNSKRLLEGVAIGVALGLAACGGGSSTEAQSSVTHPAGIESVTPAPTTPATAEAVGKSVLVGYVYSSDVSGNPEIYFTDLNGHVKNLSNHPKNDMNPQVSPDGTEVVFYSDRKDNVDQIYKVPLFSDKRIPPVTRMTFNDSTDNDPTWTKKGTIQLKSNRDDGYGDIWEINGKDGEASKPATKLTPDTDAAIPSWDSSIREDWKSEPISDSGDVFIFTSRTDPEAEDPNLDELFLQTPDGLKQLTHDNVPSWFPDELDGNVALVSRINGKSNDVIMTAELSGDSLSTPVAIPSLIPLGGDSGDPHWIDKDHLVFVNSGNTQTHPNQEQDYRIYTVTKTNGVWGEPKPLLDPKKYPKQGRNLAPAPVFRKVS